MAHPRLLLVLLLTVVSACGREVPPPSEDPLLLPARWGSPQKEYVAVEGPRVEHMRMDRPRERSVVVNLLGSGDAKFHGNVWPLASGSSDERTASREALGRALDGACSDPALRTEDGRCRMALRLNADACVPWCCVEEVLREALGAAVRIRRVQWWVHSARTAAQGHQEARMLPAVSASDPLVLELNGRRLENGAFETRLSMGDWSRTAEDDCYAWSSQWEIGHERLPADVLDAWKGIQGIVRDRVRQHDGIELRITGEREGVAWRHVVRVFDDLLGAGLREVALPGLGARLVLAEPEDTSHAPYVFPDDPVVTPLVAFLATLMVLAAFALAFLPLRIGRSARKRPRRP